jgi:hypothetical protein
MTDVRKLMAELASREAELRETRFLAPCVAGGRVRTRVVGLVCTFAPRPAEFEGWGVFQPASDTVAALVEEADLPLVAGYLERLPLLRLRLARPLRGRTWLAYPVSEADMRQRWGAARPVPVHLVVDGATFEPVLARSDGRAWWFEDGDRRADPMAAERLRAALRSVTPPAALRFSGCTPEMRAVYELAAQQAPEFRPIRRREQSEARLRAALRQGGGELRAARDRGETWLVEWTTGDGEHHTSVIDKRDLTVLSAGICLSGEDRKFDLQSLVGVVERQW